MSYVHACMLRVFLMCVGMLCVRVLCVHVRVPRCMSMCFCAHVCVRLRGPVATAVPPDGGVAEVLTNVDT